MLDKFFNALEKTRTSIISTLKRLNTSSSVPEELIDDLESQLILADIGINTVDSIIGIIKNFSNEDFLRKVKKHLINELPKKYSLDLNNSTNVIMMVGVNGTGKTTSAAKLAKLFKDNNKNVLLIAADTYRAAAIEQLKIWSERARVRLVYNEKTKDPSAVLFDGLHSAKASKYDVVIVDTAGRLHTYKNLMNELVKMQRVVKNKFSEFSLINIITIDSTLGQNSILQAKEFNNHIPLDSAILTKLDGTAKGGIIFPLYKMLGIPVQFIGVGEELGDILLFDPDKYLKGLFGE